MKNTPLNKNMRQTFVARVIADIDVKIHDEPVRSALMKEAMQRLPKAVKALYDDELLRPYVNMQTITFPSIYYEERTPEGGIRRRSMQLGMMIVPAAGGFKPSAKLYQLAADTLQNQLDRMTASAAMHERLTAMVGTCRTVADLKRMFPELEKYMPHEEAMVAGVPAVLIKDFMSALANLGVPA